MTTSIMAGIEAVHKLGDSGCTAKFVLPTIHSTEGYVEACLENVLGDLSPSPG